MVKRPVVLLVAGSDSGGGAGLQADIKAVHALGAHGVCALTSITSQNTLGVLSRFDLPVWVVESQLEAVMADFRVAAVKTGMLASPEIVKAVGGILARNHAPNLVVDPVLMSSSGHRLMDEGGREALVEELLPLAAFFTPNLAEAEAFAGFQVVDLEGMRAAAHALRGLGPRYVVVKGGHLAGGETVDVFYDGVRMLEFRGPRVETRDDHGTGCVYSTSLATRLARGEPPHAAAAGAREDTLRALRGSLRLGAGRGPVHPNCPG